MKFTLLTLLGVTIAGEGHDHEFIDYINTLEASSLTLSTNIGQLSAKHTDEIAHHKADQKECEDIGEAYRALIAEEERHVGAMATQASEHTTAYDALVDSHSETMTEREEVKITSEGHRDDAVEAGNVLDGKISSQTTTNAEQATSNANLLSAEQTSWQNQINAESSKRDSLQDDKNAVDGRVSALNADISSLNDENDEFAILITAQEGEIEGLNTNLQNARDGHVIAVDDLVAQQEAMNNKLADALAAFNNDKAGITTNWNNQFASDSEAAKNAHNTEMDALHEENDWKAVQVFEICTLIDKEAEANTYSVHTSTTSTATWVDNNTGVVA